jgi:hypothetical protein
MNDPLGRIETHTEPDGLRLSLLGEVDLSNAQTLLKQIRWVIRDARPEPVVIDLTGVEYIDSQGRDAPARSGQHPARERKAAELGRPGAERSRGNAGLSHLKDLPAQLIGETDGWAPVSEPGADLSGR